MFRLSKRNSTRMLKFMTLLTAGQLCYLSYLQFSGQLPAFKRRLNERLRNGSD